MRQTCVGKSVAEYLVRHRSTKSTRAWKEWKVRNTRTNQRACMKRVMKWKMKKRVMFVRIKVIDFLFSLPTPAVKTRECTCVYVSWINVNFKLLKQTLRYNILLYSNTNLTLGNLIQSQKYLILNIPVYMLWIFNKETFLYQFFYIFSGFW